MQFVFQVGLLAIFLHMVRRQGQYHSKFRRFRAYHPRDQREVHGVRQFSR